MGDRVCIDLCSMLAPGEGMLCGSFSRALFLVHSECMESAYINSRPFRVNAGAVHAYVQVGSAAGQLHGSCRAAWQAGLPRVCSHPCSVHGAAGGPAMTRGETIRFDACRRGQGRGAPCARCEISLRQGSHHATLPLRRRPKAGRRTCRSCAAARRCWWLMRRGGRAPPLWVASNWRRGHWWVLGASVGAGPCLWGASRAGGPGGVHSAGASVERMVGPSPSLTWCPRWQWLRPGLPARSC